MCYNKISALCNGVTNIDNIGYLNLAVKTENIYGKITVADTAIAMLTGYVISECYGVVELVSRSLTDTIADLFHKSSYSKGVKIATVDNKIYIDVFVILNRDVPKEATVESIQNTVKYKIEAFTGMRVMNIAINVLGFKV